MTNEPARERDEVERVARALYESAQSENGNHSALPWSIVKDGETAAKWRAYATAALNASGSEIQRLTEECVELRKERDALLQRPIDLAKMDSIDDDATDKMVAYYWRQQAQEARAALKQDASHD